MSGSVIDHCGFDEVVADLAGARNAADAAMVDFVADRLEADDWRGYGIKSLEHFCTWQFGITHHRAIGFTRIAARRQELTETFAKFRHGQLSFDQVHLIARHCPDDHERSVSNFAVAATIPQLSRCLRQYCWPTPAPPKPEPNWKKQASLVTNDQGEFRLTVTGDADEGERIRTAIDQYWHKVSASRSAEDNEPVTNHEAFMALIDSAADADLSTSRRNRHRTLLHIDAADLIGSATDRAPRLHLGPLVNDETRRLLTCDGAMQLVLTEFGQPVRLGRTVRTVPQGLRELVLERDQGCRYCGTLVGLDVHHLVHWADGGSTDPSNLVALCSRHHTLHHRGEFAIMGDPTPEGTADGLTFHHPDGRTLDPPRASKPSDPPTGRYQHPLGERLNWLDVFFSQN